MGYSLSSWSVSHTGSRLLLCLKKPLPGPCVLLAIIPILWGQRKGARMGGPKREVLKPSRTQDDGEILVL